MDMNWFQSILYGFLSGLTDILPVSAQAHKALMIKFFGIRGNTAVMDLMIHLGMLAALYFSCQSQIVRISRARALARMPKRKRKRPLDTRSLMDFSLLKTMLVPVVIGLLLYPQTEKMRTNLMAVAIFLLVNGVILYIPQFLPTGNRDSRTMSRIEGLLMGLGGAVSILPGVSSIGVCTSVSSVCGVDRVYGWTMALMMNLILTAGFLVHDIAGIAGNNIGILSAALLFRSLVAAVCAFAGTMTGIKYMRHLAEEKGYASFGLYCLGVALFTFILNLMA